ncbi:hypothetical protein [Oceanobacillus profundus]|uniref:Uncharacterized protein n=1 Tax=Oceanobacillus profundus TaxID=372463 RepID=A0A417YGL1_9BACI|nr:hypothetical protein [Oceanobacillus profundus]MBR2246105.1 hypothetical protein [Bacilli bacterium]MBR3119776.1 hypothetical protein [Oceanobacillus sp.]RHW31925.1 hypothetical protein D1B32_11850 [Oceanobacillus profundus]
MKQEFNLSAFGKKICNTTSLDSERVHIYDRLLTMDDIISRNSMITEDFLSNFSEEDLEWYFDFITYWPSMEMTLEPEDYDHEILQQEKIITCINELSRMKGIQRSVAFI